LLWGATAPFVRRALKIAPSIAPRWYYRNGQI
jgi:hypothetical protein